MYFRGLYIKFALSYKVTLFIPKFDREVWREKPKPRNRRKTASPSEASERSCTV